MFIEKKISTPEKDVDDFEGKLIESLLKYTTKLADAINGGMRLSENISCQVQSVTTAGADVEKAVTHTLKRAPTGFIVINLDKAAIVYDSGTTWTATTMYIKSDTATTTVKLLIF